MDDKALTLADAARSLHAERCRRAGIHDQSDIDLYWGGCNQGYYERLAIEAANGTTAIQWAKEVVARISVDS